MMKKLFLLITFVGMAIFRVVIWSPIAHAAIAFDASSTTNLLVPAGVSTISSTITMNGGANEVLFEEVVLGGGHAGETVTSTVNGAATTLYFTATSSIGSGSTYKIFYITGIGAGTNYVSTTFANAAPQGSIFLASFIGVNQSTPIEATGSSMATVNTITASSTVTTLTANDVILDALVDNGNTSGVTPLSPQVSICTSCGRPGNAVTGASYLATSTVGAVKTGYTLSGSGDNYLMGQAAIVPAASASFAPPPPYCMVVDD